MKKLKNNSQKIKKNNYWHKQAGFTLIEMLVVVAIVGVVATISTQIVISLIRSNNKTNVQNEVRQNGSFVLDKMEREIRNSLNATVTIGEFIAGEYLLRLSQSDGSVIAYWCMPANATYPNGYINRQLGVNPVGSLLNNNTTTGVRVSSCSLSTLAGPPVLVTINFTLTQSSGSATRSDLTVSQTFNTSVSLRSY